MRVFDALNTIVSVLLLSLSGKLAIIFIIYLLVATFVSCVESEFMMAEFRGENRAVPAQEDEDKQSSYSLLSFFFNISVQQSSQFTHRYSHSPFIL